MGPIGGVWGALFGNEFDPDIEAGTEIAKLEFGEVWEFPR